MRVRDKKKRRRRDEYISIYKEGESRGRWKNEFVNFGRAVEGESF